MSEGPGTLSAVRAAAVAVVVAVVLAACGAGAPRTCDEVADRTIELVQQLIDEAEEEIGEMTVDELLATGGELPAIERFAARSKEIDEWAAELGCSQTELRRGVLDRLDRLDADTPVGELIIDGIRRGGL